MTSGGRSKPLDTDARTKLMIISGKQTFLVERFKVSDKSLASMRDAGVPDAVLTKLNGLKDKEMYREEFVQDLSKTLEESEQERFQDVLMKQAVCDKEEHSAMEWMLDVMTSRVSKNAKAAHYKVFRIDNPEVLNLLGLEERPGSYRYSVAEIWTDKNSQKLEPEIERARKIKESDQKLFDTKIMELASHLQIYQELATVDKPLAIDPPGQQPISLRDALVSDMKTPQVLQYTAVLSSYSKGDVPAFNSAVADYRAAQVAKEPARTNRADFEAWFNSFAPFYHCLILYGVVFVLAAVSWLVFQKPLNRAAFWLMLVLFVVHTGALLTRMYIQDRPLVMVTNLYSSAVFIGWVAVGMLLVAERIFPYGIATFLGGIIGFSTLLIAHFLSLDGDTMEMLQAVLDTNFWLATHVTAVTIGYATTFVAGFLGLLYIVVSIVNRFTGGIDRDLFKIVATMLYGVVCFAMLFSFVGTVLGGIWADQSWGRFWGWDAKENGALLIVIWNALILHARWAGLVKGRGLAGLAVFGNIITAWSWFGVNMLGVGLHSYGFMHGALAVLLTFVFSQVAVIAVCCVPALHRWQLVPAQDRIKLGGA